VYTGATGDDVARVRLAVGQAGSRAVGTAADYGRNESGGYQM
jgi:hypothetical protein